MREDCGRFSPRTLAWQNGGTTPTVSTNVAGQDSTLVGYRPFIGDFNGDGKVDILWDAETATTPFSSTGTRVLWTSTGNGGFAVSTNVAGQDGLLSGYAPFVGDFNRDGRTDIWWYQTSATQGTTSSPTSRWTSTSTGGFTVTSPAALVPTGAAGDYQFVNTVADINADSRTDVGAFQVHNDTAHQQYMYSFYAVLLNPDGSFNNRKTQSWTWSYASQTTPLFGNFLGQDFDGDGKLDLIVVTTNSTTGAYTGVYSVYLGDGSGNLNAVAGSADTSVAGYLPVYGDFNGDGKTDILWVANDAYGRSTGNFILWTSKGDGTFAVTTNPGGLNGTLIGYRAYAGDFNGDGKADLL